MTSDLKTAQVKIIEKKRWNRNWKRPEKSKAVLLPKENPKIEGYKIVSYYKSAKEVGGDYFDFLWVNKETWPSRWPMFPARASRVLGHGDDAQYPAFPGPNYGCGRHLVRTNALLFKDIKRGMFVTMFYAIIDLAKHQVNCANAGIIPDFGAYGRAGGTFNPSGIALGLDNGDRFNPKCNLWTSSCFPAMYSSYTPTASPRP